MSYFSLSTPLRQLGLCAVAASLVGLSVLGCVRLLEPRKGDASYYLLSDSTQSWNTQLADTAGVAIGLRQPRLASYLDATRIVIRHGPHTIQFSEFHRWGEDLGRGISRTIALTLQGRPSVQSVEVVPWARAASFDYVLQLHVLNFEGVAPPMPEPGTNDPSDPPEGHSRMVVQWKLLDPTDDTVLAQAVTRHQEDGWPVGNYEALVSRLSSSLTVLANDIGAHLETTNRP